MGRGRAKAKQVKVARQLKYSGGGMDLDRLRAEFGVGTDRQDADDHDPYADYAVNDDEDEDEDDYGADDFDDEEDLDEDIDDEDELEENGLEVDGFDDDASGDPGDSGGPGRGHSRAEGGAGVRMSRANGS
jgi:Protein of unknown function (DUF3073)